MTKQDNPFHTYVEDLFANLGRIRIRKMFGGAGVYSGEDMFALIDQDQIYVKSDDALKADLVDEGGQPFEWTNPNTGKTITMSYVSLPVNALDDRDEASGWARKALDVAVQARRAKVKSPRRTTF
ncbi:MAG: TfoX/Sxy family protein [Alphaproteobacteria bacterium]|jgi:DNA transformation protein|nr:TfoX/Sxy family protein [Henriciella sp.]MBO6696004.1 TfoX/Sxy family protein [Henriciella sp.]MCH9752828.1 TfoX/Sxy family protein [Alphaproteobacteria bacterium]